jgi:hypothetical protein
VQLQVQHLYTDAHLAVQDVDLLTDAASKDQRLGVKSSEKTENYFKNFIQDYYGGYKYYSKQGAVTTKKETETR